MPSFKRGIFVQTPPCTCIEGMANNNNNNNKINAMWVSLTRARRQNKVSLFVHFVRFGAFLYNHGYDGACIRWTMCHSL